VYGVGPCGSNVEARFDRDSAKLGGLGKRRAHPECDNLLESSD
jgi:hypothetical protein